MFAGNAVSAKLRVSRTAMTTRLQCDLISMPRHVNIRTEAGRMSVPQDGGNGSAGRQGVIIDHVNARPVSKAVVHRTDDCSSS